MGEIGDQVAANIRARRRRLGWTMHQLAERADLSYSTVHSIEAGAQRPLRLTETGAERPPARRTRGVTVDELYTLAHALGVHPEDLLPCPAAHPSHRILG